MLKAAIFNLKMNSLGYVSVKIFIPDMVAHSCISTTQEAEAGGLVVQG
jgi:hypothetical protein